MVHDTHASYISHLIFKLKIAVEIFDTFVCIE